MYRNLDKYKVTMVLREYDIMREADNIRVGEKGVVEIDYHVPRGEGDAHYVDVVYEDKSFLRIFRPDSITFVEKE